MIEQFNLSPWDGKFQGHISLPEGDIEPSDFVPHIVDSALKKYDLLNPHNRPDEEHVIQKMIDELDIQKVQVDLLELQFGEAIKSKLSGITDIRQRIQAFGGKIKVGSDIDKTITSTDSYLNQIPGSVLAENYMSHPEHGRAVMPRVHARYWRPGMADEWGRSHSKKVGKSAPFREGVIEFFEEARDSEMPVTLISANFRPFVDGLVERLPLGAIQRVWCTDSEDIRSTDKGTVIKKEIFEHPDRAFIFIGDGSSDIPATEAWEYVAVYFALEGGLFAKQLEVKNLPHYTYRDFNDIRAVLHDLKDLNPR